MCSHVDPPVAFILLLIRYAGAMTDGGSSPGTVATAETYYRNCYFRNVNFGVFLHDYNDYDYKIDGSHFIDNQIGIYAPHGNFAAQNCRCV